MDRQLDISSVLQGGYATPLTRELQAERHLTKQVPAWLFHTIHYEWTANMFHSDLSRCCVLGSI